VPYIQGNYEFEKYESASADFIKILQNFTTIYEKISIHEAYLDITELVNQRLGKFF
jgi:nucleotidyltransferase/DNA polymerase involved in DNA repair